MSAPVPAPTTWVDGFDETNHAERCLGPYWNKSELLPPLILGHLISLVLFILLYWCFESLLTRSKQGKEGRALFLPPAILITITRYLFSQMIIQCILKVLVFYVFIAAGNLEVACYLQYYRPGDAFYGNIATPIVIGIIVYLHVVVNLVARPAVGTRYSRILGRTILDLVSDGAIDHGNGPLQIVFVGSMDGFHPTKLASFLQESEFGSFKVTCLDAYGQIEISEGAVARNAAALGLSDVIDTAVVKRNTDGELRMPKGLYSTQHFAVIYGDYLATHTLLGLEYENNEKVQDTRIEEMFLELRYLCAPGARVLVTNAKNKTGNKLSARWKKLLVKAGFKVEKIAVNPRAWCMNRETTLLVGSPTEQQTDQRQSVVLTVESERVVAERRAFADKVFLVTVVSTLLVYVALFAAVVATFKTSKFPKEVGIFLYFNMFALNTLMQLPGGLVVGLYLLMVQFKRTTFEKKDCMVLAAQYLAASFIVGFLQSFFFGYLFSIIINYYILFLGFGISPSSNTAVLIDIAIIFVLAKLLAPKDKPDDDDVGEASGVAGESEDSSGAGDIDLVVHTTTDFSNSIKQDHRENPISSSTASANEQENWNENPIRTSRAAAGTLT